MLKQDQWTPLRTVCDHVRIRLKDAAVPKLHQLILRQKLPIRAKLLQFYSSQSGHQFPIHKLLFKDGAHSDVKKAYNYAYGAQLPEDDSVHVVAREHTVSVWMGIQLEDVVENAQLDLSRCGRLDLDPWNNRLKLFFTGSMREHIPPGAHYFLGEDFRYAVAEGVACRQSDVERIFPYMTEFPAREGRGRRRVIPAETITAYLREIDRDETEKQSILIKKIMERSSEDGFREPAESTIRNWIRAYRSGVQ